MEILQSVIEVLFVTALVALSIIIIYWKTKKAQAINCWFCQGTNSVPQGTENFVCTHCTQYNGFDSDGGYNVTIPAQHDEGLNPRFAVSRTTLNGPSEGNSNGLCYKCNLIQEFKMNQIAKYEGREDYNVEIEHFKQQLENGYELCPNCKLVVIEKLRHTRCLALGRRVRGELPVGDVPMSKPRTTTNNRLSCAILFAFSIVNLSLLIVRKTSLPSNVILCNAWEYLGKFVPKDHGFTVLYLYMLGLFVELLDTFKMKRVIFTDLNKAFAWAFLSLVSLYVPRHNDLIIFGIELFCVSFLVYVYGSQVASLKRFGKFELKRIRRINPQPESFNNSPQKSNRDIDLSRHLNGVNIGTNNPQRLSPNPFYNVDSRFGFSLPTHRSLIGEMRNPYQHSLYQNELNFDNASRSQFYSSRLPPRCDDDVSSVLSMRTCRNFPQDPFHYNNLLIRPALWTRPIVQPMYLNPEFNNSRFLLRTPDFNASFPPIGGRPGMTFVPAPPPNLNVVSATVQTADLPNPFRRNSNSPNSNDSGPSSRSSSRSGLWSSNDFVRSLTQSLPSSRESSPI